MRTDAGLHMWDYWLGKRGDPEKALLYDYPVLAVTDSVLAEAIANIQVNRNAILVRMAELVDHPSNDT